MQNAKRFSKEQEQVYVKKPRWPDLPDCSLIDASSYADWSFVVANNVTFYTQKW